MLKCWRSESNERPSFSSLVGSISGLAEMIGGYLDISNYNPFTTNGNIEEPGEVECDNTIPADTPDKLLVSGGEVATAAIMVDMQCPSEDEISTANDS